MVETTNEAPSEAEPHSFAAPAQAPASNAEVQGFGYGYDLLGDAVAAMANNGQLPMLQLGPHPATPVPSATAGVTVGGGTSPATRMS